MAAMIESAGIKNLLGFIQALDENVRNELLGTLSKEITDPTKRAALTKIRAEVAKGDVQVRQWLSESMPYAYVHGFNDAEAELKRWRINTGLNARLTIQILKTTPSLAPHVAAVNAILSDAYLDFGHTMNGVVKRSEQVINDALRRQLRAQIGTGRLEGEAVRSIAKDIRETMASKGIAALVDKGGREWSLPQYSEMLTRTHLIRANNDALLSRAQDFEVDIVEVSTHGATDEVCGYHEGRIYSLSGKSKEYPKLTEQPPFHPNCKHSLYLRPDLQ